MLHLITDRRLRALERDHAALLAAREAAEREHDARKSADDARHAAEHSLQLLLRGLARGSLKPHAAYPPETQARLDRLDAHYEGLHGLRHEPHNAHVEHIADAADVTADTTPDA